MRKQIGTAILLVTFAGVAASCAAPRPRTKPKSPPAAATSASSSFEGIGRLRLHRGQPCATQIMFDFDVGFGETVWLAAGVKDERRLLAAIEHRRRVRIFGTWRHGKEARCRYVSVTRVVD
jgi:hypothetical protein